MNKYSHLRLFSAPVLILTALFFCTPTASAAHRMLDSIEEFGEQRYIPPTPARLSKGPVIVHPTLKTKVTWDDNILLEPSDPKDDVIFNVMPGVVIEVPIDTHQLVVGYEADIETFTKRHNQNDQNQNAFALLDLNFPSWYINVLEKFSETSGRAGTTFTGRIPRFDQSINPKIGYKWNRMTVEGGFRHVVRDFRRQVDDRLDYQLAEWTGVVYFDVFARLKTLIEYNVAQIDYDDDFTRQGTFQQVRVGIEGEVLPNLFMKLRAGPHFRRYEHKPKPDLNDAVINAILEYEPRDNVKLEFEYLRQPAEATIVGINYYKENLIRLGVEYEFIPRLTLFGDGKWYMHQYDEVTTSASRTGFRSDQHLGMEYGLRYLFREWLEFETSYEYVRRDSNFAAFDHTDHRVSLSSALFY